MNQRAVEKQDQQNLEHTRQGQVLAPAVDILENEQELLIVADMPGAEPDKIKLDVQPPEFKLEAELAGAQEPVAYVRSFHVEERIDAERVSADYKNGVLTVHLPKSSASKPRRIEVRAG
jgi:HSP20 family molecular chaperone IbpA